MTGCDFDAAYLPLKVICSTALHELARPAFLDDPELAVLDRDLEAAGGERAGEDDGARILRDVDEAAAAVQLAAELAGVDVALLVHLGDAEAGEVEPAAVVEIEHLVLVDDRVGVGRRAEVRSARQHAADGAGFGRHGEERRHLLLGRDGRNAVRGADAEIDGAVQRQLESGAARDDLALVEFHARHVIDGNADGARQRRIVVHAVVHAVHLGRIGDDHAVDENARHAHVLGLERAVGATMRSTCAMTMPPLLCAAMAWARQSSVSASFSMLRLPDGSALVARISATLIGVAL